MNVKVTTESYLLYKKDYDSAINQCVDRMKSVPGVRAIFMEEIIEIPGISEAQMICVVEDDFDKKNAVELQINANEYKKGIFRDASFIIPRSIFPDLLHIVRSAGLVELWQTQGAGLVRPELSLSREHALAVLIDSLEQELIAQEEITKNKTANKQKFLSRLKWSVNAQLLCRQSGMECPEKLDRFSDEIQKARMSWKMGDGCSDEWFLAILNGSREAYQQTFTQALASAYELLERPQIPRKKIEIHTSRKKIICAEATGDVNAAWDDKKNLAKVFAPLLYAVHLTGYGAQTEIKLKDGLPYALLLKKRAETVRAYNDFLDSKNLNFSPRSCTDLPKESFSPWPAGIFKGLFRN